MNFVFANHGKEEEIYPLTTIEIAESQKKDRKLKTYFKNDVSSKKDISLQIIDDTQVLCKNDKLIIPASLQHRAVSWYHHYLQHPGHSRLEETMRSVMYWKVCAIPSGHMSNLADLARSIRDTVKSMVMYHLNWS
jgi:hypothetical protein